MCYSPSTSRLRVPAQLPRDQPVPEQRFASSQFGHWQCAESTAEWKTIGSARDNRTPGHSRLTHSGAREIEVYCISVTWNFGPLRFEKVQLSTDINNEVHFACTVTPEESTAD